MHTDTCTETVLRNQACAWFKNELLKECRHCKETSTQLEWPCNYHKQASIGYYMDACVRFTTCSLLTLNFVTHDNILLDREERLRTID